MSKDELMKLFSVSERAFRQYSKHISDRHTIVLLYKCKSMAKYLEMEETETTAESGSKNVESRNVT